MLFLYREIKCCDILPAVHNNGSSVGWIDSFDLLEEFQHADGREWHPEVWPAGKVELSDQAWSSGAIAALLGGTDVLNEYGSINNVHETNGSSDPLGGKVR